MKIVSAFITLLSLAFSGICQAQTIVVSEIDSRGLVQDRYVAKFAPDYALFNQHGAGLIRKGDRWSLVRVSNIRGLGVNGTVKKMRLDEQDITEDLAQKILTEAAPDSLFAIGQERFDALPDICEGKPDQKEGIAGGISDAGTIIIWEYTSKSKRKIQFYAAENYYTTCYPYHPEFGILGSLLNTFSVLEKYARQGNNKG